MIVKLLGYLGVYRIAGIFQWYKMFVVFANHASTANIYTHEFLISHAAERLLFRENLSKGHSAKVYTLEIYPLYGTQLMMCDAIVCALHNATTYSN